MKQAVCPQEEAVSRALRTGLRMDQIDLWKGSVQGHVAECAICREMVLTSRWMHTLAQRSEEKFTLPDANLLWWRAHLSQKQAEAERAQKPLEVIEVVSEAAIALAAIALALAGWLTWNWSEVPGVITKLLVRLLSQLWEADWLAAWAVTSSLPVTSPFVVLPLLVTVLSLVVLLVAYPLLAED